MGTKIQYTDKPARVSIGSYGGRVGGLGSMRSSWDYVFVDYLEVYTLMIPDPTHPHR